MNTHPDVMHRVSRWLKELQERKAACKAMWYGVGRIVLRPLLRASTGGQDSRSPLAVGHRALTVSMEQV